MSSTQLSSGIATEGARAAAVPMRFEVAVLPVADVDRAQAFYQGLGWRLDADLTIDEHYRVVQVTPPASPASIIFGIGTTEARAPGPDPEGRSYGSWASFADPDGNGWLLQEIKERLPGRCD